MGAMRIARTVTGRSTIAIFTGAYHGIFDEVIVRGTRKLQERSRPRPGILPTSSQNVLVLDYGTPESLEILRQRADELAAMSSSRCRAAAPTSSRVEFLRELRALTEQSGTVLHLRRGRHRLPRAPARRAGPVRHPGRPRDLRQGRRRRLPDRRDRRQARVHGRARRRPLAVRRRLDPDGRRHLLRRHVRAPSARARGGQGRRSSTCSDAGPALQERLTARTAAMVARDQRVHAPSSARRSSSTRSRRCGATSFTEDLPYGDLLYAMLRDRGIHILDNFPCFLTTAHTDEDIARSSRAYREAAAEMQAAGFFPARATTVTPSRRPGGIARGAVDRAAARGLARRPARARGLARLQRVGLAAPARRARRRRRCAQPCASCRRATTRCAATFSRRRPDAARRRRRRPRSRSRSRSVDATGRRARARCAIARAPRHRAVRSRARPLVRAELVRLAADHHVLVFTGHHIVLDGWSFWVLVKDLAALYAHRRPARAPRRCRRRRRSPTTRRAAARADAPEARGQRALVDRAVRRTASRARPAHRPAAARRCARSARAATITCCRAELVAEVKKLGAAARRQPVRDAARRLRRAAAPPHRPGRSRRRHPGGRPGRGRARGPRRPLREHAAAARPARARRSRSTSCCRRAAADDARRLRSPGRHLRPRAADAADRARPEPAAADQRHLQHRPGARRRGATRCPGLDARVARRNPRRYETFELFVNAVDGGAAGMRLECQYNPDLFDAATVGAGSPRSRRCCAARSPMPTPPLGRAAGRVADDDRRARRVERDRGRLSARRPRRGADRARPGATHAGRVAVRDRRRAALTLRASSTQRADAIAAALRAARRRAAATASACCVERDARPAARAARHAQRRRAPTCRSIPAFPAERLAFMVEDAGSRVIVDDDRASPTRLGAALTGAARRVHARRRSPRRRRRRAPARRRRHRRRRRLRHLHLGLDRQAQGRARPAPRGRQLPRRACARRRACSARRRRRSRSPRCRSTSPCSSCCCRSSVGADDRAGHARRGHRRRPRCARCSTRDGVTVMQATPRPGACCSARAGSGGAAFKALCGGEALPRDLAAAAARRASASCGTCTARPRPRSGRRCHRVDRADAADPDRPPDRQHAALRPRRRSAAGARSASSASCASAATASRRGYLDRPELTAERFVADPFDGVPTRALPHRRPRPLARRRRARVPRPHRLPGQGARLPHRARRDRGRARHATRRRAGGGRSRARIARATSAWSPTSSPRARRRAADEALRAHLARTLPDYMVPQHFVALDALPLTAAARSTARRCPRPAAPRRRRRGAGDCAAHADRGAGRARLRARCSACRASASHDDFFALGGHSLLAAQMTARLGRELGRAVPMRAVFEHPTVAALAGWLDRRRSASDGERRRASRAAPTRPRRRCR